AQPPAQSSETLARAAASPESLESRPPVSVPVFLGGREIFRVRVGREGLAPEQRADAIRVRLTAAVGDAAVSRDSVRLISTAEGTEVRAGRHFLWLITPGDVEGLGSAQIDSLESELPNRLGEGLARERSRRRPSGVLLSLLMALGCTLVA